MMTTKAFLGAGLLSTGVMVGGCAVDASSEPAPGQSSESVAQVAAAQSVQENSCEDEDHCWLDGPGNFCCAHKQVPCCKSECRSEPNATKLICTQCYPPIPSVWNNS